MGVVGQGDIPAVGDTVTLTSFTDNTNSQGSNLKIFNPSLGNKVYSLDTNTTYDPANVNALIAASTEITPVYSAGLYNANFNYAATGTNLYLTWDYRNKVNIPSVGSSTSSGTLNPEIIELNYGSSVGNVELKYNAGVGASRFVLLRCK